MRGAQFGVLSCRAQNRRGFSKFNEKTHREIGKERNRWWGPGEGQSWGRAVLVSLGWSPRGEGGPPGLRWEGTDFGQCRFGHPDLTNFGQSNVGRFKYHQNSTRRSVAILAQAISVQDGIFRACSSVALWCCCAFVSHGSPWDATGSGS